MDELLNQTRQSFKAVIKMEDRDLILMKNEGIVSQRGNLMNLINFIEEEKMQENINVDDGARIALEEGLQRDSKAKCIGEVGEVDLSKDKEETITELKKEEDYAKYLKKAENASNDWSITKEGMENCVKFPNSTPTEIIELYRKLDFQRRELEKKRIYTHDKLLKKEDKDIFANDNEKEKGMLLKV